MLQSHIGLTMLSLVREKKMRRQGTTGRKFHKGSDPPAEYTLLGRKVQTNDCRRDESWAQHGRQVAPGVSRS